MSRPRRLLLEAVNALDGARRFVTELPKNLSLDGESPQTWVTVTKMGHFYDPRYGEFDITRPMLLQMVDNFNKGTYGQEIFLDVAHKPSDGAAGKFLKLSIEGNKLRALIEWTPFGVDAVKNRGFRYLSADYHENFQDNEARAQHGPLLFGAGLTIRPVIKGLDPVTLSEPDGSPATFLHPELQSTLLQEIHIMWKELLKQLSEKLGSMKLAQSVITSLMSAAEKSLQSVTDEAAAKSLMGVFEESGKQLAEAIGDKVVQLSIAVPEFKAGLTTADVKKLMEEATVAQTAATKKLAEGLAANVKLLGDTINAVTGFDEATKKTLAESVADLITPEMTADQVKRLAENQIKHGNELAVAKQLSAMGFHRPSGSVHITVDSSNQVKALQEEADKRLGISGMQASRRFSNTGGVLQLTFRGSFYPVNFLARLDSYGLQPERSCIKLQGLHKEALHMLFNGFHHLSYHVDRKSTRLNSSHDQISYAVFCSSQKLGDFAISRMTTCSFH